MQQTHGETALMQRYVNGTSKIADALGADVQRYSGRGMYGAECVALFSDLTRTLLLVGKHDLPPPSGRSTRPQSCRLLADDLVVDLGFFDCWMRR